MSSNVFNSLNSAIKSSALIIVGNHIVLLKTSIKYFFKKSAPRLFGKTIQRFSAVSL